MKRFSLFLLTMLFCCSLHLNAQTVPYCMTSPVGYGRNATGGGSATPVLVNSVDGLKNAMNKANNKVIIITQSLTFTSMLSLQDGSNVTLMALPGVTLTSNKQDATSSGILYIKRFDNLILRNITFVGPGAYDCDGNDLLCFEKVTNAWVDHCDFQDGCDGNFDNKSTTDNVTISWCRFRYLKEPRAGGSGGADDHRFTNLLGSSSSDKPSDGTYNFTWAYCWWDEGCKERMVRCRNASLHFLNCYWSSSVANYFIGPENVDAYVEGCYMVKVKSNYVFKSYGGTNGVKWVNSYYAGGSLTNQTSRTVVTPTYSYTALDYTTAKNSVTNSSCGAGATLQVTTGGSVYSSCSGSAPTTYTVTWNANGGSCSTATTLVVAGSAIGQLPTATKSGYIFNGWFTAASGGTQISSSTIPTGNVTYYAQYTESQGGDPTGDITWNFSKSEFSGLTSVTSTTTINGLTIVGTSDKPWTRDLQDKTVDGITFTHRLKSGGTGSATARNLNFAVTGPCIIDVYLVSGGSADRSAYMYSGSYGGTLLKTLSAPQSDPIKETYTYTGGATTIYIGSANSGVNFYGINRVYTGATPDPDTFTLSYDDNGGSGTMADQTGTTVTVAANGFTAPTGYSFKEWNTNSRGAGTKYNVGQSVTLTDDLTLYAIWQPNTYTVTLNAAGGTGGSSSVTATYDAAMPNISLPTREGYTFLGYFSEQNGAGTQYYDANGSSTNSWTIAGNATLYAAWEVGSVTPVSDSDLHFWFFYADDATTNGVSNDATVFSNMVASGSPMAGSITIDGHSYSVTRRTGDNATFGQFTIPSGKEATFYALAVSSGGGDRQINLVSGGTTIEELAVAGGSDSYKRLESGTLSAGSYTIEREGSSNVRLAVIVLRIVDAGSTPQPTTYTVTWNANGGTCATATSTIQENETVGTLPEATREGYTFDGWWTAAEGGTAVTASTIITADITFYAHWTESQGGDPSSCQLHLWFNSEVDRTSAGISQNAAIFSTSLSVSNNTISGSITIDGVTYNVTSRTSNSAPACSFTIPTGYTATFYMIAVSSGTGTRTVTISKNDGAAENTDQVIAGSKTDGTAITLPNLTAGNYTVSASGNIGVGMFGLKLCNTGGAPTTYTVTFKDNFGNTLKTETVEAGGAATAPTIPTINCYTAGTWDQAFNNVTSDLVVTVTYTVDKHSVILHYDDTQGSVVFP